ncbi:MAG: ABC transporter substrate-binding protein [Proteobacteria bacterium]|nr:ABC transporter substrate-binding protein [Pseudomonadota bacterium]MBU4470923.1 ABC transporter substrate-binding protein [Pseudomonadota bacterium]MCG2751921.1 ABC transporter substrate-binding protein [Desulfobacteraceae bacterium]
MKKHIKIIILLLVISSPATVLWAGPMDMLKVPIQDVVSILNDPQFKNAASAPDVKKIQREKLWQVMDGIFDYTFISKSTLGRFHWEKTFSPAQRDEFVAVFSKFLGNTYLDKIQEGYQNETVNFLSEEIINPTKALVKTSITGQKMEVPVDYLMRGKDGQWNIYDVNIEGVSLVQNYRSQFNSFLLNNSAKKLIDQLKSKIK